MTITVADYYGTRDELLSEIDDAVAIVGAHSGAMDGLESEVVRGVWLSVLDLRLRQLTQMEREPNHIELAAPTAWGVAVGSAG